MSSHIHSLLIDRGVISHAETLVLQHSAHINLLLSWNSPALQGIITSKLFEYLQAKKTILALLNGAAESELETLLNTYSPASLILHQPWAEESERLEQFLTLEYQRWANGIPLEAPALAAPTWEGEMEKLFRGVKSEK